MSAFGRVIHLPKLVVDSRPSRRHLGRPGLPSGFWAFTSSLSLLSSSIVAMRARRTGDLRASRGSRHRYPSTLYSKNRKTIRSPLGLSLLNSSARIAWSFSISPASRAAA